MFLALVIFVFLLICVYKETLIKRPHKACLVSMATRDSNIIFSFRLLYAIAKIAIITARIFLHLISYPQFTYDLFHMHHSNITVFVIIHDYELRDGGFF